MPTELGWEAWATVSIIAAMLVALIKNLARADFVLLGCLGLLLVLGILTPEEAFAGFSNKAVLAVAALFVVAAGVQNTGALEFFDRFLFPKRKNVAMATTQLMLTTATMSAFLNNTPLVAMLIPRVREWCEKVGVAPSKLMIPLSFAAILGGMTTLVGTSTNLLVSGLMEASGYGSLHMFDFAWAGVPAAIGAILYFALVGHRLLPDRGNAVPDLEEGFLECAFEMRVRHESSLIGKSVEEAGLRALENAYLVHLRRGETIIPSSPHAVLLSGDVLAFIGSSAVLDQLSQNPDLEQVQESLSSHEHSTLPLYEAVVAPSSRMVGHSLRDIGFREFYQGVVLGIHRRGAPIAGSLSRIPIESGDLLLVEARTDFYERWNQDREEFYLVAPRRPGKARPLSRKVPIALAILTGVVLVAAFGLADIATTAFIGALAMLATGCLRGQDAQHALDIPVLVVIAAALGLGRAIESTGLAGALAHAVTDHAAVLGPVGVVAAVYIATSLLTELITNNAAAALMVGVGLAASNDLGVPPEAFAIAVALAASASFLTPIGYQTNMMVMASGGYRFSDFTKSGLAVNIIVGVIALLMIWSIWL